MQACDVPSALSMHYSGKAAGPVHPFGFELSSDFSTLSETMLFVDPYYAIARTQVGPSPPDHLSHVA